MFRMASTFTVRSPEQVDASDGRADFAELVDRRVAEQHGDAARVRL